MKQGTRKSSKTMQTQNMRWQTVYKRNRRRGGKTVKSKNSGRHKDSRNKERRKGMKTVKTRTNGMEKIEETKNNGRQKDFENKEQRKG